MPNTAAPLYGLILIGGGSTRMGQDKSTLNYHGQAEWKRMLDCVSLLVEKSYLSLNPTQAKDESFKNAAHIIDQWDNIGPMNGIASAMKTHPGAAWLVVPCDMPGLDTATLETILQARDTNCLATVAENPAGKLEPLCAIYEPTALETMLQKIESEDFSLQRYLNASPIQRLRLDHTMPLKNINTPEESENFRSMHTPQ